MLSNVDQARRYQLSEADLVFFDAILPLDHPLQDLLNQIDWERIAGKLERFYSPDQGAPCIPPILPMKLEFLRCFYRLSDAEVFQRARTDVAMRWFLQLPVQQDPPSASMLCRFRGRLGQDGYQAIFDEVIQIAREKGFIKDRLRLKDASHVIANIAVPTALQLLAQLRERLLKGIGEFDPEVAEGFSVVSQQIQQDSKASDADTRLTARVDLLQDMVNWIDQYQVADPSNQSWQQLLATRRLAEEILHQQTNPKASNKIISLVDPDARRGKHGDWFEGYKIDILVDADSELITQVDVIAANGNEAESALSLVKSEQETFGNDIQQLSIDGAGWSGPMIREMEDPQGIDTEVFVPPSDRSKGKYFPPSDFELSEDGQHVTCPAGEQSCSHHRHSDGRRETYQFSRRSCQSCALLSQCMKRLPKGRMGRTVSKSYDDAFLKRAAERSKTDQYAEIRREHPAVERRLNDVLNYCDGRQARYRGTAKVCAQQLLSSTVSNAKRLMKLIAGVPQAAAHH